MLAAGELLACTEAQGLAVGVIERCGGCGHRVGSEGQIMAYR
jgi:hypothetical protein